MNFYERLQHAWQVQDSLLCVGLDPDLARIPAYLGSGKKVIGEFNRQIIDATAPYCASFKPQIAYYSAVGAEQELAQTIRYIKENYPDHVVILDAKRGDIGATAEMYAREAFDRYAADALTVNPYMGGDTLSPYLSRQDKGVVVLCRTSNPGSAEFQALACGEQQRVLAHEVAHRASGWNQHGNVMLVVGATYPDELAQIRNVVGEMPLLVPGVGAQGGEVAEVIRRGADVSGRGLLINSSRGILYAGEGEGFANAAARAARVLNDEINACRHQL